MTSFMNNFNIHKENNFSERNTSSIPLGNNNISIQKENIDLKRDSINNISPMLGNSNKIHIPEGTKIKIKPSFKKVPNDTFSMMANQKKSGLSSADNSDDDSLDNDAMSNTSGQSQGNRPGDAIASGPAAGGWVDPTGNINDAVYNGAADNNNSTWAWNVVSIPTSFPSNQLVHNTLSVSGSNVSDGFRTSSSLSTGTLPVTCTVSGAFLASPTRIPDSALIWASQPNYYDPSGGSNGARYTYNYTLTVGIVKRVWNGTSLIQTNVASQDISIPFRAGFYSRTADFSCSFNFSMEYQDTNGYNVEYAPYFNHNGWMGVGSVGQTAELRRNGEFTVTFVTGLNK